VPGKVSWREKLLALRYLTTAVLTFVVLLGGIYLGIFSPTEGGAAGAFLIFVIVLIRGRFTLKTFFDSLMESVTTSAMIFFIIIGAMIFAQFLAVSQLPNYFVNCVSGSSLPNWGVILIVLVIYIFLGTFLDAVAMMALTLPIVFPMIENLGVNGVWFGIMVIKMTEIALITPPLGLNVYVVKGLAPKDASLEDIFMGIFPFLLMDILTLGIIFLFPMVVTWLPGTM